MPCHIILNNPSGTYFPGSTIEGKIVCIFDKQINVNGIRVRLRGKEETRWFKSEHKKRRIYYSGTNKFLKSEVNFAGEGSVSPGTFEFPFQFVLPKNCPGSFKTDHGVIWYYLEGLVDASWESSFGNHSIITVIAPIDFNDPTLDLTSSPYDFQVERLVGCCCFSRGSAELSVHLDKAAFVLGEVVNIQVQLSNAFNLNVKGLSAKLTMVIKHKATSPKKKSKHSRCLVASVYKSGIGGQGNYDLNLLIPPDLVVPNFSMCILFKKWCILKVKAEFPGCHRSIEVTIPVSLGHVSQTSQHSQAAFIHSNDYIQSASPSSLTSPFPLINNFDAPTSMPNRAYLPEVHRPGRSEQPEGFGSGVIPTISVVAAEQEWEELDDVSLRPDSPAQLVPPPSYEEVMRDASYP